MDLLADISFWAFCVVWVAGWFVGKPTARRWRPGAFLLYTCVLMVVLTLFAPAVQRGFLGWRILPDRRWLDFLSDVLHIAGFWFAIWGRLYIGRNWSGSIHLKKSHTLVRGGPYALVRHPIYSGLLVAVLGKAVGQGKVAGFIAFAILLIEWKRKSLEEERLMLEAFGDEYENYRADVKGLVPAVW